MTNDTMAATQPKLEDDLAAAHAAAWEEHQRRCADNEPYTDGVTSEELAERIAQLRQQAPDEHRPVG